MQASPRPYRQVARAASAAETQQRIVAAFTDFLRERWMDEITLDDVAAAAGTTRQTVIRLFGGKEGMLPAVAEHMAGDIATSRAVPAAADPRAVARAQLQVYEASGDLVFRLLAQEARHPALATILDLGRCWHRAWVGEMFAPHLDGLPAPARERALLQLIAATDVYVWKLLRRDLGQSATATQALIATMLTKLLQENLS